MNVGRSHGRGRERERMHTVATDGAAYPTSDTPGGPFSWAPGAIGGASRLVTHRDGGHIVPVAQETSND
jgi:hypothetical protein